MSRRGTAKRGRTKLTSVGTWGTLGVVLCATLVALAPAGAARAKRPALIALSVPVDRSHPGASVPRDFLGLSFELSALPEVAGYANGGDLLGLLRSLGPGVLRFGGVSADRATAWAEPAGARPGWASSGLEAGDLRRLYELAAESRWRVLLTVGLGHYEPEAAAREAAIAKAVLGTSLEAIELGNEPDAYGSHGLRPEPWTFIQYSAQVAAYRAAMEAAAPGVSLAGPDVTGSAAFESWGLGEAIDQRPALLTGHHYPLRCSEVPAPTIAGLLSEQTQQKEEVSLKRYTAIARASEIPLRLDEANSVSCGGVGGVSDTFASALWAVGYIARAMSMGVSGINFHDLPASCEGYSPLCAPTPGDLAGGALTAQPEWYALLLAKALIGDRPLASTRSAPGRPNVDITTLLARNGSLHAVIVDDDPPGKRGVAVGLRVGDGFGGGSVLSLTAPSPAALSGVQLGGRVVAANGSWSGPAKLPRVANRGGTVTVDVPPSSAALVTVSAKAH
jgi:hypothetical protein